MTTDVATGATESVSLKRTLTLPLVALYGLGVTVGAGIYVLIGETAALAGAYAPMAFMIAALVVGFTAFSYAELSTRYPVSAGEAAYVQAGLRRVWIAQAVGLAVATSGIVSAAAVAIGAGGYLASLLTVPAGFATTVIILLMGLVAWWGITESVASAAIITVIEVLGLGFVIAWGFGAAEPAGVSLAEMIPPLQGSHWLGIGAASVLAFFAFVGFEDMVNVAEEVKNPRKVLPQAIATTLVVATLIYIAVVAAVLMTVPLTDLAGAKAPLTLVFADAPGWVQNSFSAVAVLATINGVLIQMIMASRVIYGMADRGQLPSALAQISPLTSTPGHATALVVAIVLALTQLVPIERLAGYTSQIVLCVFVFVNLSLIAIKRQSSSVGDYFNVPLAVPILGVVTSLALLAISLI
ncbi:MAG: APC family permease [Burkholderiaceae bacterium]